MSIYRKLSLTSLSIALALGLSSCATILGSRDQTLTITSEPANIPFVVKDQSGNEQFSGHTPFSREVRKSSLFNSYIVFYPGDKEKASGYPLSQSLDPLFFLGLLNPISLIVDMATGAALDFPAIYYNAKDSIPNHQEKPPVQVKVRVKRVNVPLPCSYSLMHNFNGPFADPFFNNGIDECTDGFYYYYYDDFSEHWYRTPYRHYRYHHLRRF